MTTKAGQDFLDWWQGREYVTVTLDWAKVSVELIEAEARQQERERIRAAFGGLYRTSDTVRAILDGDDA